MVAFREALLQIGSAERDAWLDRVLGLGELPDDGPDLPRECVPYLPCAVDVLLRMIDEAPVLPSDVFVDVGSGIGRAMIAVHLLTGATAIGVEVQRGLARASRDLAARMCLPRVTTIEADAAIAGALPIGDVYLLYCPFSGARLERLVDDLEPIARTRPLRICCVDLPLPARPWLTTDPATRGDLRIHRTVRHTPSATT